MSNMNTVVHNMQGMFSNRQLGITSNRKAKSSEKLSSGYRINRAADDAAGLTISEKMRSQIRGLRQGTDNTQDGVGWIQIGDGAMEEISDMVHRITELSVKASTETLTEQDRQAIDEEVKQLKSEINRVATTTEFNTKPIFDNSYAIPNIEGVPSNFSVFDATYDSDNNIVTFGGMLLNGERIPWNDVNRNMVTTDENGKQVFIAGDYEFSSGGQTFSIHANDGADIPDITSTIDMKADVGDGIILNGKNLINWSDLKDESGRSATASNAHGGAWSFDYYGAEVNIWMPAENVSSLEDMAKCINNMSNGTKATYTWQIKYTGQSDESPAVDTGIAKDLRISNNLAQRLASNGNYSLKVGCDETGIWLEDNSDGVNGEIEGSKKTWQEMGIDDWMSGTDISSDKKYTYEYYDPSDSVNPYIRFDMKLSDITSVDSVIDGLDGMEINCGNIRTNYKTEVNVNSLQTDFSKNMSASINVDFSEEYRLGRNFNEQSGSAALEITSDVTVSGNTASVVFSKDSDEVIKLTGDISSEMSDLESKMKNYMSTIEARKVAVALAGGDPQKDVTGSYDLTSVVDPAGTGDKITPKGEYIKASYKAGGAGLEDFELTDTMKYSDGSVKQRNGNIDVTNGTGYSVGYNPEKGVNYPAAMIDFSEVTDLSLLVGTGFNSTCGSCTKHYSVEFVADIQDSDAMKSNTPYKYQFVSDGTKQIYSNNPTIKVDINSLINNNVTGSGAGSGNVSLANALVDILDESFDYHYQQYAAEGSTLYVFDNRPYNVSYGKSNPLEWDTHPYKVNTSDDIKISLTNGDGDKVTFGYDNYNFSSIADNVEVSMTTDNSGEYIKKASGGYVKYSDVSDSPTFNPDDYESDGSGLVKYSLTTKYKDESGIYADRNSIVSGIAEKTVQSLLEGTSVTISARNYSYMPVTADENKNVAVRANFESIIESSSYDNGISIVHSNHINGKPSDDITVIPRFALNTVVMGLASANTRTVEGARDTLAKAQKALDYVSEKRSLYGAYQNRLEHTLRNNANKEENTTAAESRIRDTDMALEMVNYSKDNILQQAGQSILAQANRNQQNILSLLQ